MSFDLKEAEVRQRIIWYEQVYVQGLQMFDCLLLAALPYSIN
jgi:hypothetical protein